MLLLLWQLMTDSQQGLLLGVQPAFRSQYLPLGLCKWQWTTWRNNSATLSSMCSVARRKLRLQPSGLLSQKMRLRPREGRSSRQRARRAPLETMCHRKRAWRLPAQAPFLLLSCWMLTKMSLPTFPATLGRSRSFLVKLGRSQAQAGPTTTRWERRGSRARSVSGQ